MSGEIRNIFQEPEVLDKGSPRGLISSWSGGYFTDSDNGGFVNILGNSIENANTYLNPLGWWVCNGTAVNEPESPIFNGSGRYLPNLTDGRFLMGGNSVGGKGGSNVLTEHTHSHTISASQAAHTHVQDAHGHTQNSHNHTQNSHNHTQNSHNHTQSSHGHTGSSASTGNHRHAFTTNHAPPLSFSVGTQPPRTQDTGGVTAYTGYDGTHSHTITVGGTTATNAATTATNVATTATNVATTATNQNTTAVNQNATPAITVTGTVGTGSTSSLTENRPKYLSCLYIIKVK